MLAIQTKQLTKAYKGVTVVDALNIEVQQGELFSLLGVNGAGKTTTIKMLSCLSRPTSGDALLSGNSIVHQPAAVKAAHRRLSTGNRRCSQSHRKGNLELMCGVHGISGELRRQRVSALSNQLGLGAVLQKKAGKLSGGWQRPGEHRMALVSQPEILFLDEPTLGLDVLARSELWDCIRILKGTVTIILTTHYMEEAEALSDRVGIMKAGRLLTVGTCAELLEKTGASRLEDAFIGVVRGTMP